MPSDDVRTSGNKLIGGIPWDSDHPCFNGHLLLRDFTLEGRCDRCGEEIGEPTPDWVLEAMDHRYRRKKVEA